MIKEKAPDVQSEAAARAGGSDISITNIIPNNPQIINPFDAIPEELKARPQWIVHDAQKRPYDPHTGSGAKAGKPETWADYKTAVAALMNGGGKYAGIGFEFNDNGLVGIDLDTVRDPQTGEIADDAAAIIQAISSYTEISPSGYGFHIICGIDKLELAWNKLPLAKNNIERPDIDPDTGKQRIDNNGILQFKTPEIEMYTRGRYFTVTGRVWSGLDRIQPRVKAARELHDSYARKFDKFPSPAVARPRSSGSPSGKDYLSIGLEKDASFRALWDGNAGARTGNGSESATDIALMNKLAYWCNCDQDRMVEAFLASPYCEQKDPKHAKKAQRKDYLQRTAARSIRDCAQTAEERDRVYHSKKGRVPSKRKSIRGALDFMGIYKPSQTIPELLDAEWILNDNGNSDRFLYMYGDAIRYNRESNAWYIWNGRKWEQDLNGKIFRLAITTAKTFYFTATAHKKMMKKAMEEYKKNPEVYLAAHDNRPPEEPETFDPVVKQAKNCGMASRLAAMINTAGESSFIMQNELDQQKNLISCRNGTIDLKTAKLQPHNSADFITKIIDEDYDPTATAPTFFAFLERIFQGDADLIHYIQKVMGYCATGETREQCFFIGYGTGANGKTTLIEAVSDLLSEYTETIQTETLMEKKEEGNATPELARAKGARLVIAAESKDIASLNESQTKQLTGGDMISARPLYSQGFKFRPFFKIWLSTNHKPTIRGTDNGIWRRVHMIPFKEQIPEAEQDTSLPDKLRAERKGILAWIVQGAWLYYSEGLEKPAAVKAATEEYRAEMDVLGNFLEDCITADSDSNVSSKKLYDVYCRHCDENGIKALNNTLFGRKMTERGFQKKKISVYFYIGIKLSERGEELLASP